MHQNDGWFNPLIDRRPAVHVRQGQQRLRQLGRYHGLAEETCWFEPYMPDLDYENWDALVAMIDDAVFWAAEADVDGFRVDAVKHFLHGRDVRLRGQAARSLRARRPALLPRRRDLRRRPRASSTASSGRTRCTRSSTSRSTSASINTLATYSQLAATISRRATAASDATFGDAPMSPFLGNHDVARFLTTAAGMLTGDPQGEAWSAPPAAPSTEDAYFKQRLALTFVATSPGVPLVYYGDEYGQPGAGDPDNRRFMKWPTAAAPFSPFEQATLDVTKKLGAARAELVALRRGDRKTLWIDDDHYVFARTTTDKKVAIVVLNRSFGGTWTQAVPVPSYVPLADGTVLHDRLGGPDVTVTGGTIPVVQGAHSSAVLAP